MARGTVFQDARPGAGFKTGDFVKEMSGRLPQNDSSVVKNKDLPHKYLVVVPITMHTHVRRKSIGKKKTIGKDREERKGVLYSASRSP